MNRPSHRRELLAAAAGLVTALAIIGLVETARASDPQPSSPGVEIMPCMNIYSFRGELLSNCGTPGSVPVARWTTCVDGRQLIRVEGPAGVLNWGYNGGPTRDGDVGYAEARAACTTGS